MSMWRPEETLVERAESLLLQVAVRKQAIEALKGSRLFGRWARDWIKIYNEIIACCVKVIRDNRANYFALEKMINDRTQV